MRYFSLVKLLKGSTDVAIKEKNKDNNGKTTLIIDGNKELTVENIVFNTINNYPEVSENISSSFKTLNNNKDITGFEIIKDDKTEFYARKEEFEDLSREINIKSDGKNKQEVLARLSVVKAIFEPSKTRKWEFIYSGTKISATISDIDFLNDLASGKISFSVGTVIEAKMVVVQEWNDTYKTWIYTNYVISKVINVINTEIPSNYSIYDK